MKDRMTDRRFLSERAVGGDPVTDRRGRIWYPMEHSETMWIRADIRFDRPREPISVDPIQIAYLIVLLILTGIAAWSTFGGC